ncbi:MAG: bifunctional methylenetetrahydrofolate dehydrogenase/methenyltetrahydrofolate cyclohydrolase FolD [Fusobacteriaceae bacterium]|jgi:methylenetetrahydrofolate dehydrogenase (NADP+)/methenyltetrahydrofolate cyclohydrolase|nr:bifunctional methylenetetrahydrofolate dehydrogenase/methenyltetrahydrofolate cyclohydrolase FolD [Fusobacteriaceae bacterium]
MNIIDGKKISSNIKEEIKKEISVLKEQTGKMPGLAIIIVGENEASKVYVKSKIKSCEEVGIKSINCALPENTSEEEIINTIKEFNKRDDIDGILVQLPLPKNIDEKKIIDVISLNKDVDGFKPENLGLLFLGEKKSLKSCTPLGIMELFYRYNIDLKGKDVVIIGRSNIVGKPMMGFMINAGATATICNSNTKNLEEKIKNADILIVAMGKAKYVKGSMVKNGAVVIDVGINRTENGLCGDVDYEEVSKKASYITPVPGGVGPMTVAMLLKNTLSAFKINKQII